MVPRSCLFGFVLLCIISAGHMKQIPDYIQICKRDQSTINACVRNSVEALRPKMIAGIPELGVPGLEPFYIPELVALDGNSVPVKASGKDVKVTGAGNFTIKSVSLDLDTLTFRARLRFPKLHFDGRYKLDAQFLVLPIHGSGKIIADAYKCDAELVLRGETYMENGLEYMRFPQLDVDINVKDYRIKLDGLFNGDQALGQAANEAINQNKAEFLKTSKPYIEKTVSKLVLDQANKIVKGLALDEVLPKP